MVHLYNVILLSHKKERIWDSCHEVREPEASHTEDEKNKEEKKQVLYINAYTWNLEKQYW